VTVSSNRFPFLMISSPLFRSTRHDLVDRRRLSR
jgi:hypothetical protein